MTTTETKLTFELDTSGSPYSLRRYSEHMDEFNPVEKLHHAESTRTDVSYHELSIENIPSATTVLLLRERKRGLYAPVEALKCTTHAQFVFESKEGNGDNASKVRNINFAVHFLLDLVNKLRSELNKNAAVKSAWKRANMSGGFFRKTWRELSWACVTRLSHRRDEIIDLISSMGIQMSSTSLQQSAAASNVNRSRLSVPSMDTDDIVQVPTVAKANRGNTRKIS